MKKDKVKRPRKAPVSAIDKAARRDKFKRRLVPILLIGLLGVATIQFVSSSLRPLREEIARTEKQAEMTQLQTSKGLAAMANQKLTDAENVVAVKKMPSDAALSNAIDEIDSLARRYNLTWTAGAPSAVPVVDANLPSGIQAWSMGATFTGPISSMYRFLDNLETIDRVVTVESVSLQQAGGTYTGSFLLRFYALGS